MVIHATVAAADSAQKASQRRLDVILLTGVVVAAVVIGWLAASATAGTIPAQNAMFDADTGRVLANLTGVSPEYYRLKVHPWHGWVCVFYQFVMAPLFVPEVGIPLLCISIAAACAGLVYVVQRRLDIGPWTAAAHVLLFCSTAAFVFWSTLPETHMVGGLSTLVAVLVMTGGKRRSSWRSIVGFAVGFSMVVTDVMVWVLNKIEFEPLRRGLRPFVAANCVNGGRLIRQAGWSVLLVFAVWAPQWLFLRKRIGIPFNFLEERRFVEVGTQPWDSSLHVLGIFSPDSITAIVASIACIGVLVAALRVLPPRLWFIPLFPLFGVVLHAVYGSDSAFLFSPNYLPLFIVSLALVITRTLPRWSAAALPPIAAVLLFVNLGAWHGHLHSLAAAGRMRTYQAAVNYLGD